MKATTMKKYMAPRTINGKRNSGNGVVLIAALLVLAMVTVMGLYGTRMAGLEQHVASNTRANMSTFFYAESGLNHGMVMLANEFDDYNSDNIALGNNPTWSYALDGTAFPSAATEFFCQDCDAGESYLTGAWTNGGVQIISRSNTFGNLTIIYTVTLWDNDESYKDSTYDEYDINCANNNTDPIVDCDGYIVLRSVTQAFAAGSTDPVSESIQEMVLQGSVDSSGAILPGVSQEFANEGSASGGSDLHDIDFTAADFQRVSL